MQKAVRSSVNNILLLNGVGKSTGFFFLNDNIKENWNCTYNISEI